MNPIQNSPAKEQIRLHNDNEATAQVTQIRGAAQQQEAQIQAHAQQQEQQIQQQLSERLRPYQNIMKYLSAIFALVTVAGLFLYIPVSGFLMGIFLSALTGGLVVLGLGYFASMKTRDFQEEADDAKRQVTEAKTAQLETLDNHMQGKIVDVQLHADEKTTRDIQAYEREVNVYSRKILKNAALIQPMTEHTIRIFQRVIAHADTSSHIPFIQANLIFTVKSSGISYQSPDGYANPQDDFNFERERYHDLNKESECEGLAQALARLTYANMMKQYPAHSIQIHVEHTDAQVTMRFQGANKNYIPAKDIF